MLKKVDGDKDNIINILVDSCAAFLVPLVDFASPSEPKEDKQSNEAIREEALSNECEVKDACSCSIKEMVLYMFIRMLNAMISFIDRRIKKSKAKRLAKRIRGK